MKAHIPFCTLVTAFLKNPVIESMEDWIDLSNCYGGGGGTTIFFGESKTGCSTAGLGVDGGVMNTVYGPIFPIIGGGVESLLIDIETRIKKKCRKYWRVKWKGVKCGERERNEKSKEIIKLKREVFGLFEGAKISPVAIFEKGMGLLQELQRV